MMYLSKVFNNNFCGQKKKYTATFSLNLSTLVQRILLYWAFPSPGAASPRTVPATPGRRPRTPRSWSWR